jgi:hypothetical protein
MKMILLLLEKLLTSTRQLPIGWQSKHGAWLC